MVITTLNKIIRLDYILIFQAFNIWTLCYLLFILLLIIFSICTISYVHRKQCQKYSRIDKHQPRQINNSKKHLKSTTILQKKTFKLHHKQYLLDNILYKISPQPSMKPNKLCRELIVFINKQPYKYLGLHKKLKTIRILNNS